MDKEDLKKLERDASSGNPKAIRALFKAHYPDGKKERDPVLYPWAGDRWRRMHWAVLVLDPALMIPDKGGVKRRHVRVSEAFAAKNERGRVEPPRDPTGRRVPAVQKDMPWHEWLWFTGTGGYPQKMKGYRPNNTPAQCFYQVEPAIIPPSVPLPPPPPPNAASVPHPCELTLGHDPLTCRKCLEAALRKLNEKPAT